MKIAIIGAGNMGGAIARGLLKSGFITPAELTVADVNDSLRGTFQALGTEATPSAADATVGADMVILAVKPWLVEEISSTIASATAGRSALVVSIAAGVTLEALGKHFNGPVFRVMPNIAATVGESMTFIASENASRDQINLVSSIFRPLGEVMELPENLMDTGMALASCGIAYAFRYIRAAVEGGVELGMTPAVAQKIVMQTLTGATSLLETNKTHPEAEIDKVTTPGGATIKGLNAMEKNGFTNAVIAGLKASLPNKKQ